MDDGFTIKRPPHPRNNANLFEILTFGWTLKLFKTGNKRDLIENDLYATLEDHTSSSLGSRIEKKWKIELAEAKRKKRNPSLLRALVQTFGAEIWLYGFVAFINEIIFSVLPPFFLGRIIVYYESETLTNQSTYQGIFYGIGLMLTTSLYNLVFTTYSVLINTLGMKMRISMSNLIYNKTLRLSKLSLSETTVGQIVNLLSNDVNRFDLALLYLFYLLIGPLQTLVIGYFLWQEVGISSIFGIAALFLFIPLQGWLGKISSKLRLKTSIITDERLRLMNEIIASIQVIKMYTWEKFFAGLVQDARMKELRHIKGFSYIRTILSSFAIFQTKTALFFNILSYIMLGNFITFKKVFIITLYYNILQRSMTIFFPQAIGILADMRVSIKRFQDFFICEEKDSHLVKKINENESTINGALDNLLVSDDDVDPNHIVDQNDDKLSDAAINFYNVTAKWDTNQTDNYLNRINLTIKPGQLVAIVGAVGSGKSTLIQAILRELPLSKGKIIVRGIVSYASQEPWLFSSSVQQNILFGLPMDKERYNKVIKLCALSTDFKQLSHGDKTIVGEKGISLSGGQKARINLARAVYKQADIYLLDDPLSAVDTHVGKHLFEKCIKEYLKEKTCILITHNLQYLTSVDQIVVIKHANVIAVGSYGELQCSGLDLTKLIGSSMELSVVSDIESNTKCDNDKYFNCSTSLYEKCSINSIALSDEESELSNFLGETTVQAETRSFGNVPFSVYSSYFSAGGRKYKLIFLICILIVTQMLSSSGDFWIATWVNLEEHVFSKIASESLTNRTKFTVSASIYSLSSWFHSRLFCVIIFAFLIISLIITTIIMSATFVSVCTNASANLHDKMFSAITRSTMNFFNTNTSGRILNRFSKDIGEIDDAIQYPLMIFIRIGSAILGVVIILSIVNIYLLIPTIILATIFYEIRVFYLPTSRSVKRLEGITRSPIITHLNASIQGIATIRAFKAQNILSKEFNNHQDLNSSASYLFNILNRAFGFWMDIGCLMYLSVVIFSFLIFNKNGNTGYIGLAITEAMKLIGYFQYGIRQFSEFENLMTSVERVLEYTNSPQEAALESLLSTKPSTEWPYKGQIVFQNFYLSYFPSSSHVLENLNIRIESMEKIGIVGRTGAGKSSLIKALFRLAHNEGSILIDDININELGLRELRSKLSIIPQEPVLFSGTIRKNLDPLDEYSDHTLWNALEEVELKDLVDSLPDNLNSEVSDGGSNFSVGQRQLVCLARAILKNNKIILLDEATANVDTQTESLIQNTIRNKFQTSTVLTISHRLNPIMNSDKVLVLDAGKMVEFAHPYCLLQNINGYFYKMVEQTGPDNANFLHNIALKMLEK